MKASLDPERTRFAQVRHTRIHPDPDQPRRYISEEEVAKMADSIRTVGLLEPLTLRMKPGPTSGPEGDYLIVSGETRWLALGRLGWELVPSLIRLDMHDDDEAFEQAFVINAGRTGMNVMDEAAGLRRIFHHHKFGNNTQLARRVGRSEPWVTQRLLLLQLPEDDQQRVRRGELSIGDGVAKAREISGRYYEQRSTPPATSRPRPTLDTVPRDRGFGTGRYPATPRLDPGERATNGHANGRPPAAPLAVPFAAPGTTAVATRPAATATGEGLRDLLRAAYRAGVASLDPDTSTVDEETVLDALMERASR